MHTLLGSTVGKQHPRTDISSPRLLTRTSRNARFRLAGLTQLAYLLLWHKSQGSRVKGSQRRGRVSRLVSLRGSKLRAASPTGEATGVRFLTADFTLNRQTPTPLNYADINPTSTI
jgi:hypothetical protein